MNFNRATMALVAPVVFGFAVLSAPASAQTATPSGFEQAMLAQLDATTRASVEQRAVDGNTVMGVVGTTLLNNYYEAGARKPGEALSVIAVDFTRGIVVFQRAIGLFEVQRFDPQTLRLQR